MIKKICKSVKTDFIERIKKMKKSKIARTALVNLKMMADFGVPEAIQYQSAFQFEDTIVQKLPKKIRMGIGAVAEILYKSTNRRIEEINHKNILDFACGFGPRAFKMVPMGYKYIGGDLLSVVDVIYEHLEKQEEYKAYSSLFKYVDVTDRKAMREAIREIEGEVTIVTQGLLTYLNAERKHLLASNVYKILEEHGGCWMIPDGSPDQTLKVTFNAIMGNSIAVNLLYVLRDCILHRNKKDKEQINWNNSEEIVAGLEKEGFKVEILPLWEDGLELKVFDHLKDKQKQKLVENWKNLKFIIATVP